MRDFVLSSDPVVPMLHPRIIAEVAAERGAGLGELLRGTGIPPAALRSPEARISPAQYGKLIDNAVRLTGDPALGVAVGSRVRLHNLGMLGLLLMSCATFREALEAGIAYHRSIAPVFDIELLEQGPWARIRVLPTLHLGAHDRFAAEMVLHILDGAAQALLGRDIAVEEVCLPYSKPEHFDRYHSDHVGRFRFDADAIEVCIDARLLDERLGQGDPITAELARRQCASQLGPSSRGLLGQIRDHLDASPGHYPSMDKVAHDLRTSPRSLRRYLRGMSTSYQAMVDEARRRHAEQAVRDTTLTIHQVAQLVGYEDVRGFRRAWLRWTGQTPSEYRRHLRGRGSDGAHAIAS